MGDDAVRGTPGRTRRRPVRVDYYSVQPSSDQWIVVASVEDGDGSVVLSDSALVVGAASSREAAIGDMVRRLTRSMTVPQAVGLLRD